MVATSVSAIDDIHHNITQICNENGFNLEVHEVTTEDGYILTMHRIPSKQPNAPSVLLQHGIEDTSMQFVINSPDKAPAFILSREGYDVWMGNNRGNFYSMRHVNYTKDQKEFWDFEFEQMGLYDVPAFANYIKNKTQVKDISYVGHSEGTSQFFIGSSMLPDYYEKTFNLFVALAPIARIDHTKNTLLGFAAGPGAHLIGLVEALHLYNLVPRSGGQEYLAELCKIVPQFCVALDDGYWEWHSDVDNLDRYPDKMAKSPSGSGYKNLFHYAQIIGSKQFQRFDFGKTGNLKKYNSEKPPKYDLSKIKVPMAMFMGDIDQLSDTKDDAWLLSKESGLPLDKVVFQQTYHLAHVSFMMAQDMTFFTKDVVGQIKKFNPLPESEDQTLFLSN